MTAAAATKNISHAAGAGQIVVYGDTTYTKVFVGGLAWETQKETMKSYFQQFGDIIEAVVISDKSTGRSKGYGFVTFREPEAAMRACVDAAPVIDGRRANCNLASMGVQKSKPSTPKHGGGGARRYKLVSGGFHTGFQGVGTPLPFPSPTTTTTFPHYAFHQPNFPYNHVFGYSPYSSDYTYPTGYYNVYGGATGHHHYPVYGATSAGHGGPAPTTYFPYFNHYAEAAGAGGSYSPLPTTGGNGYAGLQQFPHHQVFQYSGGNGTYPNHHYGTPISVSPSPALPSGVAMALHAPIPHHL